MKITLDRKFNITISEINGDEILALIEMIKGAGLTERRLWFPVFNKLTKTPFDKLDRDKTEQLKELANEVRTMRKLQRLYFKSRSQDTLKESIAQERKVDDLLHDILYL